MENLVSFGTLVLINTGLVEAIKLGFGFNKRFIPILAVFTGILLIFLANQNGLKMVI